ncbi:MAG: hypothetical protein NC925_02460 [Candidatus Omnitrophica bacterium]|nr:hypothetical protein [Candidatus Omnitrophota bacterium]MCM8830811.1 hypothetical protein [Candidatus Omnitrophota bacterium]
MRYKSIFILFIFLFQFNSFCQQKVEKEEQSFEALRVPKLVFFDDLSLRAAIYGGYDSNVNLSKLRKGDAFQEFLLYGDLSKKITKDLKFLFNYNLDVLNYSEFTDASNILNHFTFTLQKKFDKFLVGWGYDLGILYYPHNEDGDFLFHKAFIYLKHNISKTLYQKLSFNMGYKYYTNKEAYSDSLNTYLSDKRHDWRYTLNYSIGSKIADKLFLGWDAQYLLNYSNVLYIDFYDYSAFSTSIFLNYELFKKFLLYSRFSYTKKDYKRLVTLADYKQEDNLYVGSFSISYLLNKNNSLNAYYTYRYNDSNDWLADYFEHVSGIGWQYRF